MTNDLLSVRTIRPQHSIRSIISFFTLDHSSHENLTSTPSDNLLFSVLVSPRIPFTMITSQPSPTLLHITPTVFNVRNYTTWNVFTKSSKKGWKLYSGCRVHLEGYGVVKLKERMVMDGWKYFDCISGEEFIAQMMVDEKWCYSNTLEKIKSLMCL